MGSLWGWDEVIVKPAAEQISPAWLLSLKFVKGLKNTDKKSLKLRSHYGNKSNSNSQSWYLSLMSAEVTEVGTKNAKTKII